jgi:hypothetical protein
VNGRQKGTKLFGTQHESRGLGAVRQSSDTARSAANLRTRTRESAGGSFTPSSLPCAIRTPTGDEWAGWPGAHGQTGTAEGHFTQRRMALVTMSVAGNSEAARFPAHLGHFSRSQLRSTGSILVSAKGFSEYHLYPTTQSMLPQGS